MRSDTYAVRVSVDGRLLGTWDKMTGGEIDSEELTYKPGNMGAPVSLGGSVNIGNVVVSRLYDLTKVLPVVHWLINRVGKGNVVIKKQALDTDGNAVGRPLVYKGKLKTVTPPEVDSESNDAGLLALEVTCDGTVT